MHVVQLILMTSFYLIAFLWLLGYRITRKSHEANLQQLVEAGEAIPLVPGASRIQNVKSVAIGAGLT